MSYHAIRRALCAIAFCCIASGAAIVSASAQDIPAEPRLPLTNEPVSFVGHGAFFDTQGREINADIKTLLRIVDYYSAELLLVMTPTELTAHNVLRQDISSRWQSVATDDDVLSLPRQQLLVKALLFDDQLDRYNPADGGRLQSINTLIKRAAVEPLGSLDEDERRQLNETSPFFKFIAKAFGSGGGGAQVFLFSTLNSGAAYIAECSSAGVPIPPDWGSTQWTPTGSLSNSEEFISRTSVARPNIYNSTAPEGACIALPRTNTANTSIGLLGIICVGKQSGNACFWDNQEFAPGGSMTGDPTVSFPITVGTPLALSAFMGGADLVGGGGGRCSHCHAGENPYVIHPGTPLGRPAVDVNGDLQKMPVRFHDPIVHPSWYQNEFTSTLVDEPEASRCSGCHSVQSNGSLSNTRAGRLPKLSQDIRLEYCFDVLKKAINIASGDPANTMPLGGTLSAAQHGAITGVINDFCDNGTDPGKDAGDPHITTTDGVNYDFQAAGEFVLLKDQGAFEVQARQKPIPTSFFPGANAHTGVASCVSVNSAVAARVGDTRVTFQPGLDGVPDPAGMELRIDGVLTPLTSQGVLLSEGGRVRRSGVDGLEIDFPNGEYLSAVPGFWNSQGHWFLNITVSGVEARRGVMGSIPSNSWLPRLPDGVSVGLRPSSASDRYDVLNRTFANAWRVTPRNSLFDYAPGQGPADFLLAGWPKDVPECTVPDRTAPPAATRAAARAACARIDDPNDRANCEFDFELTGADIFPEVYEREQQLTRWGTKTTVITVSGRGRPAAERTFGVFVAPRWTGLTRQPKGAVEVSSGGVVIGDARPLDGSGLAYFDGADVADHDEPVTANFIPAVGSEYLPSDSGPTPLVGEDEWIGGDRDGKGKLKLPPFSKIFLLYFIILLLFVIIIIVLRILARQRR